MATSDVPRPLSPSRWRSRLIPRRPSQEPQAPPKEVSRWSKTTTESELSEAGLGPASKKRNLLKKKIGQNTRKGSKDSAKSSPTDPFYNPITKQLQPYGAEVPAIVTSADNTEQPRTFLDDASDDDTIDSPTSPVIQRASSVRVSRPHVIQHSNSSAASVPKLFPPNNTPSSLKNASSVSVAGEEKNERAVSPGGPSDALKALEGNTESKDDVTALPQIPDRANVERRDTLRETIVSWPDTPSRLEALDTMPTPMGGFGSMRIPRSSDGTFSTNSTKTYVSPSSITTDGLRSNPPSESDRQLSRAISAPVRNSRRVMIRPADLVINRGGHDHKLFRENIVSTPYPARKSSHVEIEGSLAAPGPQPEHKEEVQGKKPHRLRRSRPLSHTTERAEPDDKTADITEKAAAPQIPNKTAPEVPLATRPSMPATPAQATSKSDRFPSPSAPEILFLDLHLARHHGARATVEIEVTDKTTFDDEQLFTIVRRAYTDKLMGKARWWFCARTLEGASLNNGESMSGGHRAMGSWHGHHAHTHPVPSVNSDFDSADFTRHILTPRLGRRRKHWLLWLRNVQPNNPSSSLRTPGRRSCLPQPTHTSPADEKTSSPVFSFMHSRQNSSEASPVQEYRGVVSSLVKQPSVSNPLPRMPFNSPPSAQTPSSLTSFHRSKSLAMSSSLPSTPSHPPSATVVSTGPPAIYLHHTFSIRAVALFTLLTLFLAIFTAVLWILFGYPGRSAAEGDGTTVVGGKEFAVPWRRDAQSRVGVGLVMGVVVLLVGGLLEVGWVWASWVLV
ncbi:hypothetical protein H2200_005564 [Cladophialophora chaetospira]|uniref:Uncharacterized protein n=1 Tax=Cladophialophora chaetospira TaxID=386627 RepID=A0AA39CJQ5_9EURO|nr:hypothetical protein H2200_005564 [Cladophialophora chaetospira]